MGKNKSIKDVPSKSGNILKNPDDNYKELNYPIFCFKHLHKDYNVEKCDNNDKIFFLDRLVKLSSLTWTDLQLSNKHGFGSEKISINSIIPKIPKSISPDVISFLSLRFNGKKPFIGYRNGHIFHIIFIDRNFSVYNH